MTLPASDPLADATSTNITTYSANWSAFAISGGQINVWTTQGGAFGLTGGGASCTAWWNADVFPNDQYSQCTIANLGSNLGVFNGPAVRCSNNNYYWFAIKNDGTSYILQKNVAGTFTNVIGSTANTFSNSDVVKISVTGQSIALYQNNVLLNSATDASLTSGSAGISTAGATGIAVNTWSGGAAFAPLPHYIATRYVQFNI